MAVSAFAQQDPSAHEMAQINITPLVDVMLVLLVIFMVTMPIASQSLDLRLPQSHSDMKPPPRIALTAQGDGSFLLDGATLGLSALPNALAEIAQNEPKTVIEIGAADDADYQGFARALAAARDSGITNIALER